MVLLPSMHTKHSCLGLMPSLTQIQMVVFPMSFGRPRLFFSGGAVPLVPCQLTSSRICELKGPKVHLDLPDRF